MYFRPVLYLSAVPEELHTARDHLYRTLLSLGYRSVWAPGSEPGLRNDELFARHWGNLRHRLDVVFARSSGVIQLVGQCHGKALEQPDKGFGQVSRTQFEALYAKKCCKNVWYIVLYGGHPVDACKAEPLDLREQQAEYRRQVKTGGGPRCFVSSSLEETEDIVLNRLGGDLLKMTRRRLLWALAGVVCWFLLIPLGLYLLGDARRSEERREAAVQAALKQSKTEVHELVRAILANVDSNKPRQELEGRLQYDSGLRAIAWHHNLQEQWLRGSLSRQADEALNDPGVPVPDKMAALRDAGQFVPNLGAGALAPADQDRIDLWVETARFYLVRGGYQKALRFAARAADLANRETDFATWAAARHELGLAFIGLGRQAEALKLFRELVPLRTTKLGVRHPDTLRSGNGLAQALAGLHHFSEAEQQGRAVLAVQTQVLGEEHLDTLASRTDLAMTMDAEDRHGGAEWELRNVLAMQQRVLGAEHLDTLRTYYCLALCLDHQHRRTEAGTFAQQALGGYLHVLGDQHPRTKSANGLVHYLSSPQVEP
jgi:tetratricopeptide (TPR) repeat protein